MASRLIVFAAIFVATACKGGPFTSARDLVVADPVAAVRDARTMIEERKRVPGRYGNLIPKEDIPASLRVPGLVYLHVHEDHVDLVLARNPDWNVGGRIWAAHHRAHSDEPTQYKDVFFYDYTNDLPESPENIR